MLAIIFPGQGSQFIGMGKDFYDNYEITREIFEEISEITKINLKDIIFENQENKLNSTEFTQISIFAVSISIFSVIKDILKDKIINNISYTAGHSLGEYSAICASKSISISQCSLLLKKRGKYMQNSDPNSLTGMLAVIGLNINLIENILKNDNDNLFEIANHNGINQIVISLKKENINKVTEILNSAGAKKIIPLNVSAGFHSNFMSEANNRMIEEINNSTFTDSIFPIVFNYNAQPSKNSNEIVENIKKQMINRVNWVDIIKFFENNNIKNVLEVGPNKVLNGLNKRISDKVKYINVSSIYELENLENVF
ncbi:MAG: Malonyl CoA-acyl carrier protein transacylase [Alphaproteobacteria bacterium MarineAlpha5_Bin12]|nr:[acyl-carrier-protein] S-malonyltransferase [Pelagibacteraceae bacterium]PPR41766.1 MAG: Malonyl CoA-acyl carrier protein transacylase [Alphaproteobacteria bacterium MarineAlpha5_Bin12]|tara:strand:+ start:25997 stop:26932 length:936 start_codon:yes stop_codon:yes gene_type:complete